MLVSWSLLETSSIFSTMVFSVYLEFNEFQQDGTTTDYFYEVAQLYIDVNYTVRVESVIPYSTQTISSTIYHLIELEEVTGPTVLNVSQSTQTGITTPTVELLPSLFSEYSTYIFIGGIFIIGVLLVSVVIISVVACFLLKKHISKLNATPNPPANTIPFEIPALANEIYEQIDYINQAYLPEKGEFAHTNPMAFEVSTLSNETYGEIGNQNPFYAPDEYEIEFDLKKDVSSKTDLSASHHYEK